jgi:deferrochelatase/peroxidase EfeB
LFEFLFGYPTQHEHSYVQPGRAPTPPVDWMTNGSLLVFRRLTQDVLGFKQECQRFAEELNAENHGRTFTAEGIEAMLVGRRPKGTPLVASPDGEDEELVSDPMRINFFDYADYAEESSTASISVTHAGKHRTIKAVEGDYDGLKCPAFAHTTVVNPRGLATDRGEPTVTQKFRLLRRGMPFGTPIDPSDSSSVSIERGLLFLAYMTSFRDQFKRLNTRWMNTPEVPRAGGDDLFVGQNQSRHRYAQVSVDSLGLQKQKIQTTKQWVTSTGGAYFFAPSIPMARRLSRSYSTTPMATKVFKAGISALRMIR